MAKNTKLSIAFYEKYLMTVEEAAVYFHIGYKKMRSLIKDYPGARTCENRENIPPKKQQI